MSKKIMRVADHAKVSQLEAELDDWQARLPGMRNRLQDAEAALASAQAATDAAELAVLAGRAKDAELAQAQSRLADAKREYAIATHDVQDTERYLSVLPSALEEARQAALVEVVSNLREQYGLALREFTARLQAAEAAHEALVAASEAAEQALPAGLAIFGPGNRYGAAVYEAGDAVLLPAAGLARMDYPNLTPQQVAEYVARAEAILAALPGAAEEDKARKVRMDNHLAQQEAEERRKQAAWAAHLRRDVQWILSRPSPAPYRGPEQPLE